MRVVASRLVHACNRAATRPLVRRLHELRQLPYDIEDGLGDFLPPDALRTIAVDYQGGLLERLNDLVRGTEYESLSLVQTIIAASRQEKDVDVFNAASQALNNDFFLENLRHPDLGANDEAIVLGQTEFAISLRNSFGSLDNLKSVVSATAMGMQSSGWVWLVNDSRGELAALPTFGAGTILVMDRIQNNGNIFYGRKNTPQTLMSSDKAEQKKDNAELDRLAAADWDESGPSRSPPRSQVPSPTSGAVHVQKRGDAPPLARTLHVSSVHQAFGYGAPGGSGQRSGRSSTGFGATIPTNATIGNTQSGGNPLWPQRAPTYDQRRTADDLVPIFCISVHEHAWMAAGLGVWGKEEYLRRFWTALDWPKVVRDFHRPTVLSKEGGKRSQAY